MNNYNQLHFPGIIPGKMIPNHKREKNFRGKSRVGSVLLLGGGVQSTCLAYMMHAGVIDPVDLIIFSDTQDEPWWVYQTVGDVRRFLSEINVPLETRINKCGGGSLFIPPAIPPRSSMPVWVKSKVPGKKPGRLRRQCTTDLKSATSNKAMREFLLKKGLVKLPEEFELTYHEPLKEWLMLEHGRILSRRDYWPALRIPNDVYLEVLYGITTDESMRAKERGPAWQKTVYPLIDLGMSRDDCVDWIKENGYPMPEKSACVMCPYRSNESWLWMKINHPDVFERACQYDQYLRSNEISRSKAYSRVRGEMYLHQSCIPLSEVPLFELVAERQGKKEISQFELEVLESCGADGGSVCMS